MSGFIERTIIQQNTQQTCWKEISIIGDSLWSGFWTSLLIS